MESSINTARSSPTAMVLSSAMYAIGYVLARYIDPAAGVGMFVTQAAVFAWLTLTLLAPGGPYKRPDPSEWASILFTGALGPAMVSLIMIGSAHVTPSLSSLIVISNVLFIAIFARALGRKKFIGAQAPALIAGFIGVAYICAMRGGLYGEMKGVALLTFSALLIAIATIIIERPLTDVGWAAVSRWSAASGAVTAVILQLFNGGIHFHSFGQTGLALIMGVFSMGAPGVIYSQGMSRMGSADSAVYKLLIPFFALLYGVGLLGETPDVGSFMAGILVAGSLTVYHIAGLPQRALADPPAPELAPELCPQEDRRG